MGLNYLTKSPFVQTMLEVKYNNYCTKALCIIFGYFSTFIYPDGAGRWSSDNCRKKRQIDGRTTCDCSQLGHFGLLFVSPIKSLDDVSIKKCVCRI